ncbi:MAG: hypothetical protein ACYDG2_24835 [Ruminiclostridium sp.]
MSNIFKNLNLTDEEQAFIKNIKQDLGIDGNLIMSQKANALATFYLAKQIEESNKSNDKSSNRMFWLTIVLAVFAGVQAIQVIPVITNFIKELMK